MGTNLFLPFRGGHYSTGASAGVFAFNINNPRSYTSGSVGFRAALPSCQMRVVYERRTVLEDKGIRFPAVRQKNEFCEGCE